MNLQITRTITTYNENFRVAGVAARLARCWPICNFAKSAVLSD
jgi:hypothetical protein